MKEIRESAWAKLNISLDVTDKRPDGYHDMIMVMQTISLSDSVVIRLNDSGKVRAKTNFSFIPGDERNLAVKAALKEKGIPSMVYYPRGLHQQEAYRWMELGDEEYPNTVRAAKCVLSLPMHPYLEEKDQRYIIDSLLEVL